jgi:hypothetical protein
MTWPLWILSGLVWLTVWVWIAASYAATKEGDAIILLYGLLLPAFCAATCLAMFVAVPVRLFLFHEIVLWAHHTSIFLLFLFLICSEYFQAEAWWRIRRGCSSRSVAASFRRLWVLTETMPAPIAVIIFLTGFPRW